jgi:hypothetical protein
MIPNYDLLEIAWLHLRQPAQQPSQSLDYIDTASLTTH